jgi:hypothetical protein
MFLNGMSLCIGASMGTKVDVYALHIRPFTTVLVRPGGPPQPIIDTKDAIIGPISTNLVDITNGYRPIMKTYNQRKSIPLQTAIVSIKLVYASFNGLQCVIIWGKKNSNSM